MRRFSVISAMALIFLTQTATSRAHGVDGFADRVTGYCITARYNDGEPMNWSEVRISAPDSDIEFQNGRTDRNGRFMFFPDGQGLWEVVVQDGMGHRLALEINVTHESDEKATALPTTSLGGKNRLVGLVAGLAVIFGLCGFFYGWKARRNSA